MAYEQSLEGGKGNLCPVEVTACGKALRHECATCVLETLSELSVWVDSAVQKGHPEQPVPLGDFLLPTLFL